MISKLHAAGALAIMATDLLALAVLTPPGELGADIAIGSAQRFGVPMGYGGPHAAFFATRDDYKRAMPGRLIGVSVDSEGHRALRMAMQTREQHIRREKATSNICTAQVLLAVIASMFAVYNGPKGIAKMAQRTHRMAEIFAAAVKGFGYEVATKSFFDTVTLHVPGRAHALWARAKEKRINLRFVDADHLGVAFDQSIRRQELEKLLTVFKTDALEKTSLEQIDKGLKDVIPDALRRTSSFLTHPVFSMYHSETDMLRYLRHLQVKDVALDQSMIPLGSCTMKLNATTEMIPITWRGFAMLHPFAPLEQAQGYSQLFEELEAMLAEITGFDAVSLQPNAGSQGEYAGLLAIRGYHESRGEAHRNVCLIPVSAHGTNPASAVMAGMKVVVVACDEHGNVDVGDLRAKAKQHETDLAALMITYPSTHGVFEEGGEGHLRHRPRAWRSGLSRRGQSQRPGGPGAPGGTGRRCLPHEPAQDLLHPAWRRRTRHGPHRRQGASGPSSAGPSGGDRRQSGSRPRPVSGRCLGRPLGLGLDPADLLDLHRHDGR